jgi:hypothetical protein
VILDILNIIVSCCFVQVLLEGFYCICNLLQLKFLVSFVLRSLGLRAD